MTPEEQYVKCMDAAYAAADRETCLKMMRKAEGVLRGEFNSQPATDGSGEQADASISEQPRAVLDFEMGDTGIEPVTISLIRRLSLIHISEPTRPY